MTYTSGDPEVFQKGGWEGESWLGVIEDEKMGGVFVICTHSQIKK